MQLSTGIKTEAYCSFKCLTRDKGRQPCFSLYRRAIFAVEIGPLPAPSFSSRDIYLSLGIAARLPSGFGDPIVEMMDAICARADGYGFGGVFRYRRYFR